MRKHIVHVSEWVHKVQIKDTEKILRKLSNIFSTKEQILIPWDKIIKIGNDVIIVDYKKTKKLEKFT